MLVAALLRITDGEVSLKHLNWNSECQSSLADGQWFGSPGPVSADKKKKSTSRVSWLPNSCYVASYDSKSTKSCLHESRVIMIGDSSMRSLFFSTSDILIPGHPTEGEAHKDIKTESNSVTLEFYWDPWLNRTDLYKMLLEDDPAAKSPKLEDAKRAAPSPDEGDLSKKAKPLTYIVAGAGLWPIRYGGDKALETFRIDTTNLKNMLTAATSRGIGSSSGRFASNFRAFFRLTPPIVEPLLSEARRPTMTNERLSPFNDHLVSMFPVDDEALSGTGNSPKHRPLVTLARPSYALLSASSHLSLDGVHYRSEASDAEANLFLNEVCNPLVYASGPGFTQGLVKISQPTCCVDYGRPFIRQTLTMAALAIFGTTAYALRAYWTHLLFPAYVDSFVPNITAAYNFGLLNVVMYYCFMVDRTSVWPKVNKFFNVWEFFGMSLLWLVPALITLRKEKDSSFLNRYQTDEWKGWMQYSILVYHYTGASSVLPIYMLIRILVAAYLFMTGYGHTSYFLNNANASKDYKVYGPRILKVLFRLNLSSAMLAYVMGTDAAFYYFGPLVSVWFLIIAATWIILPTLNASPTYAFIKIVVSTALAQLFLFGGGVSLLLWVLQVVLGLTWDPVESQFRLALDPLITHIGMLTAFIVWRIKAPRGSPGTWFGWQLDGISDDAERWRLLKKWSITIAWVTMGIFAMYNVSLLFSGGSLTKKTTNAMHPFVSVFVVPAFVVLRNSNAEWRGVTSYAMRWIGEFSLETFVLQYHIWLAIDTKGLLVPFGGAGLLARWLGFAVSTVAFFGASQALASASDQIVEAIVPKQGYTVRVLGVVALLWVWNFVSF